jgi:hypothetical protein
LEVSDENEFRNVVYEMYLLEVLWRAKGNPQEAERMMNLRVRLKKSVGIETTFKEENKPSE